jgi:AraC-like DNA-binding protein
MQNQSNRAHSVVFQSHPLPADFPIAQLKHTQTDKPVTRLHQHDYLELGYCHQGSGLFMVQGKILPFTAGDAIVINRDEMHLAQSTAGTTSQWTFIMVDPGRLLVQTGNQEYEYTETVPLGGPHFNNLIANAAHPDICRDIRELREELEKKAAGYRSLIRGLMWTIMVKLHRLAPPAERPAAPSPHSPITRISPALAYTAQHYKELIRLADLAGLCSLSEPRFRRVFIAAVGRPPQEYLMQLRVRMAMALLSSTDKQIADIALEVGYETLSSFNRNFHRIAGVAPREWRKKPEAQ